MLQVVAQKDEKCIEKKSPLFSFFQVGSSSMATSQSLPTHQEGSEVGLVCNEDGTNCEPEEDYYHMSSEEAYNMHNLEKVRYR